MKNIFSIKLVFHGILLFVGLLSSSHADSVSVRSHPVVVPASALSTDWAWQPQQFRVADSDKILTAYRAYLAVRSPEQEFMFHNAGYILDAYETYLTKVTVDNQDYNYASIHSLDSILFTKNGLSSGITSPEGLLDAVSVKVEAQLRNLMNVDVSRSNSRHQTMRGHS